MPAPVRVRHLVLACSIAALVAAPTAVAATPPTITGPTAAALARTSVPSFTWTLGPAGEVVSWIRMTPLTASSQEEDFTKRNLSGVTSYVREAAINAGTYEWTAGWNTATGVSPYEYGSTTPQRFTVPPRALVTVVREPRQANSTTLNAFSGDYRTNVPTVNVTCQVFDGRTQVAKQVLRNEDANSFESTTTAYCNVRVPESLDGKRLRAAITVTSGRTTATRSRFFTAR